MLATSAKVSSSMSGRVKGRKSIESLDDNSASAGPEAAAIEDESAER
jgi:hypothetical protein